MLEGAEPKSPLAPGTVSSARTYQEVRPTLCPLWAPGQKARLLARQGQPFEPWFEGLLPEPFHLTHNQTPSLGELKQSQKEERTCPGDEKMAPSLLAGGRTLALA